MLDIFQKNSVKKIARVLPPALVKAFEKKSYYSIEEVKSVFTGALKTNHNIEYAFAMFCLLSEVEDLEFQSTYDDLRAIVSTKCFGGWLHFNFDSLLDYSKRSKTWSEGGFFGGDGSCGDGGE